MKVTIINMSTYDKQFQYYSINKFLVLRPREKVVIDKIYDNTEVSYYESLRRSGFDVCFSSQDSSDCSVCQESQECFSFEEFTDSELKLILSKLCSESKLRARWKIERKISELAPKGCCLRDYLE